MQTTIRFHHPWLQVKLASTYFAPTLLVASPANSPVWSNLHLLSRRTPFSARWSRSASFRPFFLPSLPRVPVSTPFRFQLGRKVAGFLLRSNCPITLWEVKWGPEAERPRVLRAAKGCPEKCRDRRNLQSRCTIAPFQSWLWYFDWTLYKRRELGWRLAIPTGACLLYLRTFQWSLFGDIEISMRLFLPSFAIKTCRSRLYQIPIQTQSISRSYCCWDRSALTAFNGRLKMPGRIWGSNSIKQYVITAG